MEDQTYPLAPDKVRRHQRRENATKQNKTKRGQVKTEDEDQH